MMKTVTVLVERKVKHPVYGKYLVQSTTPRPYEEKLAEGDTVESKAVRSPRPKPGSSPKKFDRSPRCQPPRQAASPAHPPVSGESSAYRRFQQSRIARGTDSP
jgi:hypothetical protein